MKAIEQHKITIPNRKVVGFFECSSFWAEIEVPRISFFHGCDHLNLYLEKGERFVRCTV